MSVGFRGSRAGSGRIGRGLRGAAPAFDGLDPVSRGRWVLALHLGDAVDVAVVQGSSVDVSRLSLAVLRVLAALEVRAPKGGPVGEGVTPTDVDVDAPDALDRAYAELCSAEIRDASDPES